MSIILPLLVMWIVPIMISIGPMECIFFRRCWANFDLLFQYLKSRKCSWKRTLKGLLVCPVYFILQVVRVNWQISHFSYSFWACLCRIIRSVPIVLSAVNAILTLVFLNNFVMNFVSFPTYVNLPKQKLTSDCCLNLMYFNGLKMTT